MFFCLLGSFTRWIRGRRSCRVVEFTGTPEIGAPTKVMDYFDGNTVTALWNYAQNFAISDN